MAEGSISGGKSFVEKTGLHAPVVLASLDLLGHFRVAVYPWTVVVDRSGHPVTAIRGGRSEEELRSLLAQVQ